MLLVFWLLELGVDKHADPPQKSLVQGWYGVLYCGAVDY